MRVFSSTSVDGSDEINLFTARWQDSVSIVLGDADNTEQVTLDFYDPAVLDRLAEAATAGAARLRAKLAESDDDQRPAELVTP